MLFGALSRLMKYPLLVVIPIVVDGLSVLLGAAMHGFNGSRHFTLKLTLQMGLPSISAVTEQGFMPGAVQLGGSDFDATSFLGIFIYFALFLVIQSFLQGGYVGLLYEATSGSRLSLELFATYGKRFFVRFLLLDILVLAFLFVLGGLALTILQMPGIIVFTVAFLLLRVLFLFLEFTLVVDDCSITEAFSRSRNAFRHRTPNTLPLVFVTITVNILAGLLVNALWLPFFFLVLLVIYDIASAGLQFAFMYDFRRIRG